MKLIEFDWDLINRQGGVRVINFSNLETAKVCYSSDEVVEAIIADATHSNYFVEDAGHHITFSNLTLYQVEELVNRAIMKASVVN